MDKPDELAKQFADMAEQITQNASRSFGGAFVIVPPDDISTPVGTLILDTRRDPAQFWAFLQTKCALALAEIEQKERAGMAYGRNR